jgi:hypothetical protein
MAKRSNQATAEAADLTNNAVTAPQLSEVVSPRPPESPQVGTEQPAVEQTTRKFRANPFPVKTENLGGYKVQLQESRPERKPGDKPAPWEMQIKFGDGSREDMPPDFIRDYVKSHKLDVVTKAGEAMQVQLFQWNDRDRAWGMTIDYNAPKTSRNKAEQVFEDVVRMIAEDRGVGQQR